MDGEIAPQCADAESENGSCVCVSALRRRVPPHLFAYMCALPDRPFLPQGIEIVVVVYVFRGGHRHQNPPPRGRGLLHPSAPLPVCSAPPSPCCASTSVSCSTWDKARPSRARTCSPRARSTRTEARAWSAQAGCRPQARPPEIPCAAGTACSRRWIPPPPIGLPPPCAIAERTKILFLSHQLPPDE